MVANLTCGDLCHLLLEKTYRNHADVSPLDRAMLLFQRAVPERILGPDAIVIRV
jgi:hypothetical protein